VGAIVGVASIMVGMSSSVFVLAAGFFLLRMGGQGLLVHTALTATARSFPSDGGKALAIVDLAYSAGQFVLPIVTVLAIESMGWRLTWLSAGALTMVGMAVAAGFASASSLPAPPSARSDPAKGQEGPVHCPLSPWLMTLACPAMLCVSFVLTGFLFHQARLANEKGWSLSWIAGWFAAFAAAQAATSIAAGPVIDRIGSLRVVPIVLVPLALSLSLLAAFDSPWIAPAYFVLLGIAAALDSTLGTTLWAELFGFEQLGRVRSRFEAIRILVVAAAPLLIGVLFDSGVSFARQALLLLPCIFVAAVAFLLLRRLVGRRARSRE
jgi:MFS family permease